jgi:hypothetical protein
MPNSDQEHKLLDLITDLERFAREKRFARGLNIFEAAGMQRQEIRHSNFLAFLLNPQETHGLGDAFLKRMLQRALNNSSIDPPPISALTMALADFSDALVSREWRNIDLLVESKNNTIVFAIENKVDSTEGEHQLSTYAEIVKSKFPDQQRIFAYLTKDGEPPSDQLWSAISYSDVIDALQEARSHHLSNLTSEATVVIDHYIALIRRNIVPDQELVDQCRKLYAKHKDALDLVLRYGEVNTFETAANQFFESHADLKLLASRTGRAAFLPVSLYDIAPQMEGTNWWGQSRPILYWFNLRPDNRFGLILEVGPFVSDKFNREALVKKFLAHFKSNIKVYPKYTRVYSEYRRLTDDQAGDPEEMLAAMNALYETVVSNHLAPIVEITRCFFKQ